MIYLTHTYFETPHKVIGVMENKKDSSFLMVTQPPTVVETIDHTNKNKKGYIIITNSYDKRLYLKS